MREAFPKKGKAVLVLIHLIKSKPQSLNQQKLNFYSDSCNWTKSEHVGVFTDQARACEGSGAKAPAQWVTHLSCLHKAVLALAGGAGISFSPKVRQVALFGGHFCWADVCFVFHCLVLQVMIFAFGWKSLLLLWRSPGTIIARKPSPQSSDLTRSASALGLRASVHLSAAQLSRLQERFQLHRDSGDWLIWKCAESHHCLETYGYYSLIKGN